jgi:hypothetical protein
MAAIVIEVRHQCPAFVALADDIGGAGLALRRPYRKARTLIPSVMCSERKGGHWPPSPLECEPNPGTQITARSTAEFAHIGGMDAQARCNFGSDTGACGRDSFFPGG